MNSQVTSLIFCTLFSKALSLTCQQCLPLTGNCEQTTCTDQCLTSTTSVYMSGIKSPDVTLKTCGTPEVCVSGSMNLGAMKMGFNSKCCKTNNCNSETLPALPRQSPNGKICYTCEGDSCSGTVNCEGNEDRCITASVKQGGNTLSVKGCVSQNYCAASGPTSMTAIGATSVKCCEGNLCNGAEMFKLSLLLMIVSLLPFFLFY
ncbi:urokinase plasminogen activator surface receptor-like isoform X1 [Clarias gariepinus]|uniref:urokinase plasminogen activator surface receptor-like isoform X1 n=2 Tax=Clarias gariepinus TaxID=13013 RepID=UPI00234E15A3|nr:urokinase plasminogen activator surface receptor-like isoform X1 [Clarias gariepinus]